MTIGHIYLEQKNPEKKQGLQKLSVPHYFETLKDSTKLQAFSGQVGKL